MSNILRVENVEKYYGNKKNVTKALNGISFNVNEGEFLGIMGASGSGKTTLLNCVSTIDRVTSGNIFIDNQNITELSSTKLSEFRRKKLGFVFQDFNLLDTLTAFENIALALTINNVSGRKIVEMVDEVAKKLEIKDILNKYPYELSGGQKQRVASARAIVTNPTLILADEPTGALDSKSSRALLESFDSLNSNYNSTIMMVTHDPFSASFCNRILFIKDGKIFNEIYKGDRARKEFFSEIINVVTLLGGDNSDIL